MKKTRLFLFITFLLFSQTMAYSEMPAQSPVPPPPPGRGMDYRNFHGKRMPEDGGTFSMIFAEVERFPDGVSLRTFFTQPINAESVKNGCILLDGNPVDVKLIRFSKNGAGFQVKLPEDLNLSDRREFSITIQNVISISGTVMETVKLDGCHINSEYHYSWKEKQWKKS